MSQPKSQFLTVPVATLKWVARALPTQNTAPVLQYGCLDWHNGRTVVVATDTRRLHVASLGESPEHPPCVFDLRRVLHEAAFVKVDDDNADHVSFGPIDADGRPDVRIIGRYEYPCHGLLFPENNPYPAWQRVLLEKPVPVQHLFAIDYRYLADAVALAKGDNGVVLKTRRPKCKGDRPEAQPILFEPREHPGEPPGNWFAIVMPMAREANERSWWEVAK